MAPEHIRGEPEQRSDLYALGVILYQLLTNQRPFTGKTPEAVMMQQLLDPPPALRSARPDAPAALEPMIQKALAKKLDDRYQTAEALLAAFKAAVGSLPAPVLPPAPLPTTIVAAAPPILPQVGTLLLSLTGHTATVTAVVWSPDGRRLASASADKTVRLWDPASGQSLATLSGHTNWVQAVVWSPDGRRLASASWDRTVRLWDPASGKPLTTLSGHTDVVLKVAWSSDGRRLASASRDQTVRVWWVGEG